MLTGPVCWRLHEGGGMTKAEFLRAWEADVWSFPLPPDQIPITWMRAAWKINAVRQATLDLMGQNVSKAGRLGYTVAHLNLLDKALGRRQVMDVYYLLRNFEPHREGDWREEFERGFPSHRSALPPVRSELQLIALLGREQAAALGVIKEQG
jgi:hypothetical protein